MKTLLIVLLMVISIYCSGQYNEKQLTTNDSLFVKNYNLYYNDINPMQKWWFCFSSKLIPDSLRTESQNYTKDELNKFCDNLVDNAINKINNGQHYSNYDFLDINPIFPTGTMLEMSEYRFKNYYK